MAFENEKVLQTRIINKHADLATWEASSLVLKEGEIALAKVNVAQKDGTVAPTFVAKIGNGASFADSPWLFAKASDVYGWAKAETKPSYNAGEIARNGSTVNADLATIERNITDLQTAIGADGSVATAIKNAIEALDVAESKDTDETNGGIVISSISETDGKISVTRRALTDADIASLNVAMEKVTGLADALALKANAADVKQTTDAITTRLDSGDIKEAIDAAKKAGDDAQAYAEGVNTALENYKTSNDAALAGVSAVAEAATTVEEATQIANTAVSKFNTDTVTPLAERVTAAETAIADEIDRATDAEEALDGRLTTVEGKVDALSSATHFLGVKEKLEDVENPVAGDIVIVGNKEYVYDTTKNWVELGDTTAELEAIDALEDAVSAIQADLGADGETTKAIAAAQDAADAAQDAADAAQDSADEANAAIAVLKGTADETGSVANTVKTAVDAAVESLEDYADKAEEDAVTAAKGYTDEQIGVVDGKITALSTTVSTNAEAAAAATKKVADDLAAEILRADAAEKAAAALGQQGIDDAAAALKAANDLAAGQVKTNKEAIEANAADIASIEANYARVENNQLVYGQDDKVYTIVFDCGGAE